MGLSNELISHTNRTIILRFVNDYKLECLMLHLYGKGVHHYSCKPLTYSFILSQLVPSSKPQFNTPSYPSINNTTPDHIKPMSTVNELNKRFANKPIPTDLSPPSSTSTPVISPTKHSIRKTTPTPVTKPSIAPVVPPPNKLEDQVWFKQSFDRKASEAFLRSYRVDGGFVVRPSTQEGPGNYSYSIYYQGEIRHLKIRKIYNNKYSVGEEKDNELEFDSVMDCVKYHRNEPLILKAGGEVCLQVLQ